MHDLISENPVLSLLFILIMFAFSAKSYFRYRGLKNAEMILERQFEPADKKVLESGLVHYKGEARQRYLTLLTRMRQQYGHDGLKVGHQALLVIVTEDTNQDVNTISIPSFIKNEKLD